MNTLRPLLTLSIAISLAFAMSMGCDLPQDGTNVDEPDAAVTLTGKFSYVRITDDSNTGTTPSPGADIDAIVVFSGGETFVSAGCSETSLFGEDRDLHGDNPFMDPDKGTLSFKEQSDGYGYVSLGGGTLICELPVAVQTGDSVFIYEMEEDKKDSYRVILAEDFVDGQTADMGVFSGSSVIDL